MKINYTLAATLAVGVTAFRHNHHHRHFARKIAAAGNPESSNSNAVDVVVEPVVEYELDGKPISSQEAEECMSNNECVRVDERPRIVTTPAIGAIQQDQESSSSPPVSAIAVENPADKSVEKPSVEPSKKPDEKPAKKPVETFAEKPMETSTAKLPTPPPSSSSAEVPPPQSTAGRPDPNGNPRSLGLKCSDFPSSDHGVVRLDWLKEGPWSSVQRLAEYRENAERLQIVEQSTSCEPGCMCAYACKAGYGETQWPRAHGNRDESIGGLYCNADGMLEMTNPRWNHLCRPSAANVKIENRLPKVISTCRTAYPGNEAMVIPAVAEANSEVALFVPSNTDYISPFGGKTSAHYYVNNLGLGPEQACVWESAEFKDTAGDLSPIVIGGGVANDTGLTFLSINPNHKCKSKLDYNIFITGDLEGPGCSYVDGVFAPTAGGCTAAIRPGGSATFIYTRETSV